MFIFVYTFKYMTNFLLGKQ